MDFRSGGKTVDRFDQDTILNPLTNGEEYRLFGTIIDLLGKALQSGKTPHCYGGCARLAQFFDGELYLAREQQNADNFPDCFLVNNSRIFCIEHTRINASKQLENGGDEYSRLIGNACGLFDDPFPDNLNLTLKNVDIRFDKQQLQSSFLAALDRKILKLNKYIDAVRGYIGDSPNKVIAKEDQRKPIEAWLLIEDISPATSLDALFSNDEAVKRLKAHPELSGIIYIHHARITRALESLDEIAFIFNDELALTQLEKFNGNNE